LEGEGISRHEMIYHFIAEHPGTTKTEVVKHMKGKSALATTHKIIKRLILEKKIICIPDESNSQIHHLYLDSKNSFNILQTKIRELERSVSKIPKPTAEQIIKIVKRNRDQPIHSKITGNMNDAHFLLLAISLLPSTYDKENLYLRITKIILEIAIRKYSAI